MKTDDNETKVSDDGSLIPITSLDEFNTMLLRLAELEPTAERIANKLCDKRASILKFEPDLVVYEYNDSCNCHPEDCRGEFPAEYLFDPEWERRHDEQEREAARKKAEAEAAEAARKRKAAAAKKERDERATYERLRKKFGTADE